jgi:Tfp pilus assembly protein PilN
MVDKSIELNEQAGVQFSLSFLIQVLGTVILAVWGYSQLDARISQSEHIAMMHTEKINAIEADIKDSQDKPIPSDYVQNTTLTAHAKELSELKSKLQILEQRLYDRDE